MVGEVILVVIGQIAFPGNVISADSVKRKRLAKIVDVSSYGFVIGVYLVLYQCVGDIPDRCDVADIVHHKVYNTVQQWDIPDLVFGNDVSDDKRIEHFVVDITVLFFWG